MHLTTMAALSVIAAAALNLLILISGRGRVSRIHDVYEEIRALRDQARDMQRRSMIAAMLSSGAAGLLLVRLITGPH
jgi:hypothetical protein